MRAAAVALAIALAAPSASAAPSVWERVREPRTQRAERTLVRMERVFDGVAQAVSEPDMLQDFRRGTVLVAEMSGASELGDPRILLLAAEALLGLEGEREAEIQALVQRALGLVGEEQLYLEAELRAVDALAARSSASVALPKLSRALANGWQPHLRAELFRRRAEARMVLADLRGSLRDARSAAATAPTDGEKILGCFAIALALERFGDERAAFEELRVARLLATSVQAAATAASGLVDSFVFRPADALYLAALRAMEAAEAADEPEQRLEHYERALGAWSEYLRTAPSDDRWLGAARAHQSQCERLRRANAEAGR